MKNILLAHLGSFGDCLYATAIARQIKSDYPDYNLTWAVGAKYQSVIQNNPHIDKIWVIENPDYYFKGWKSFENECNKLKNEGIFDLVFFTQIYPKNLNIFDGTIRSSILRAYSNKISDVTPVIKLTDQEIQNVDKFISENKLENKKLIVFEFAPSSRQSFVDMDFALKSSKIITEKFPDKVAIILSSHLKIKTENENIIDGSCLTFRENAELLNRADLLIGCSSGLTWLSTANWVKKISTIQLINNKAYWFAGMIYDFEYHGLNHSHIIELPRCTPEFLLNCINFYFEKGIVETKQTFNYKVFPKFFKSFRHLQYEFIVKFQFKNIKSLYKSYLERHGFKNIFIIYTIVNILLIPLAPVFFVKKLIKKQ